jgi:hypothetical protein
MNVYCIVLYLPLTTGAWEGVNGTQQGIVPSIPLFSSLVPTPYILSQ